MPPKAVRGRSKPLLRQSVGDEPSARLAGEKKQKNQCTDVRRKVASCIYFLYFLSVYTPSIFSYSIYPLLSSSATWQRRNILQGLNVLNISSNFRCRYEASLVVHLGGKIQMFLLNTDATVGVPSERASRRQCGSRPARSCSQVARRPAITLALPAKNEGEFSVYSWLRLAHDLMC